MTTEISELLDGAARQAVPVVRGVCDDQLGEPTPCADYTVRELLNHLFHVVVGFQALAAKKEVDFSSTPDYLGRYADDWRDRFAAETERLVEAWAAPGADEGTAGGMGLPARSLGNMVLLDLTVHAWDLARATGREFAPGDEARVRGLRKPVEQMAPTAREMKVFGEPFPVPEGAPDFDLLLSVTGRDPGWSPPAGA